MMPEFHSALTKQTNDIGTEVHGYYKRLMFLYALLAMLIVLFLIEQMFGVRQ
jgi:hypothetical protein